MAYGQINNYSPPNQRLMVVHRLHDKLEQAQLMTNKTRWLLLSVEVAMGPRKDPPLPVNCVDQLLWPDHLKSQTSSAQSSDVCLLLYGGVNVISTLM